MQFKSQFSKQLSQVHFRKCKTDDEDIGEGKKKKMLLIEGIQPKPIDGSLRLKFCGRIMMNNLLWNKRPTILIAREEEEGAYIHPPSMSSESTHSIEWDEEPTREEAIALYDDIWNTNYVSMQYMNTTIMASSALC
ncbi:hypothetical protein OROMI_025017 [Orobanche minor]